MKALKNNRGKLRGNSKGIRKSKRNTNGTTPTTLFLIHVQPRKIEEEYSDKIEC